MNFIIHMGRKLDKFADILFYCASGLKNTVHSALL
jgi:hypothetical protein